MMIAESVHERREDARRITNFVPFSLLELSISTWLDDDCVFEQASSSFTTIAISVHEKLSIIFADGRRITNRVAWYGLMPETLEISGVEVVDKVRFILAILALKVA
jgi:hypothetical protein